jgi:hypothetical protein
MEVGQARLSYDQNGQRASANSWRKPVLNHFRQSFFSLVTVSFPESTEASPRFSCRKAVKENWSEARRRASLPILGPMHPWAQSGRVERSDIPRQNYILYNKHSVTFRLVENYFRTEHMVLNTVIEMGSMEATKELVKLGLGVSILAPWVAKKEIEAGSVTALPLGRRKLQRHWGILRWEGRSLNLAEETFLGLCESATAHLRN